MTQQPGLYTPEEIAILREQNRKAQEEARAFLARRRRLLKAIPFLNNGRKPL